MRSSEGGMDSDNADPPAFIVLSSQESQTTKEQLENAMLGGFKESADYADACLEARQRLFECLT